VAKVATHQHIWKPGMFGGVMTATLCGIKSTIRADAADLNVGDDVTCKVCLAIIRGERASYGKQFIGMSHEEVEAMVQNKRVGFYVAMSKANPSKARASCVDDIPQVVREFYRENAGHEIRHVDGAEMKRLMTV
jgi:hypothetical protein